MKKVTVSSHNLFSLDHRTVLQTLENANKELEDLAALNDEEKTHMSDEIAELHAENTKLLDERPVVYLKTKAVASQFCSIM